MIVWMVPKVGKLMPCWKDSWFCGGGGVGCLALSLVGLLGCSVRDMLFAGVSEGK
jgi:hypothetical protein